MSTVLVGGVWNSGPEDCSELLVLLVLADSANDDGVAGPSVEHLGARCRMAVDEVVETLERLKRRKWLETAYRLNVDRLLELEARR